MRGTGAPMAYPDVIPVRDLNQDPVAIRCIRCGRTGRYSKVTLLAEFGPDYGLPEVLSTIASRSGCVCINAGFPDRCNLRFELIA